MLKLLYLTLLLINVALYADHQFYTGPEIYHVDRSRKLGTTQTGWMWGGKIGYDRLQRYAFYWGIEGHYAKGRLEGKTAAKARLRSHFTDSNIEGRFGYTFAQKTGSLFAFTPYLGVGQLIESNNFVHPSPLEIHTRIKMSYACIGFLSSLYVNPCWKIGANFAAKFMIEAKNKVSHDPEFDNVSMFIKNETHYRLELPIRYFPSDCYDLGLVPFYEYRHYGQHANYPCDFFKTKLNNFGLTLLYTYHL